MRFQLLPLEQRLVLLVPELLLLDQLLLADVRKAGFAIGQPLLVLRLLGELLSLLLLGVLQLRRLLLLSRLLLPEPLSPLGALLALGLHLGSLPLALRLLRPLIRLLLLPRGLRANGLTLGLLGLLVALLLLHALGTIGLTRLLVLLLLLRSLGPRGLTLGLLRLLVLLLLLRALLPFLLLLLFLLGLVLLRSNGGAEGGSHAENEDDTAH